MSVKQPKYRDLSRPLVTGLLVMTVLTTPGLPLAANEAPGAAKYGNKEPQPTNTYIGDAKTDELSASDTNTPMERSWPVITAFLPLRIHIYESPQIGDRGGGIAAYGDGLILANRAGALFLVSPRGELNELPYRVPVEIAPFERQPEIRPSHVGVHDIYLQRVDDDLLIFASFDQWIEDQRCYVLKVMLLRVPAADLQVETLQQKWEPVFQTFPCIKPDAVKPSVITGTRAGGRIDRFVGSQIIVTVGDYGLDGVNGPDWVSDPASAYGKTFVVNYRTKNYEIFTTGHRNPQGLLVSGSGQIWSTEHGPQGGDELNRLERGANYGWPFVIYGTDYASRTWPLSKRPGRHDGYARPFFAWTPSVAVSQLVTITQPMFEAWRGDLMVSTLRQHSLYRMRIEEGRTIMIEKIDVFRRVRDIVEMPDGTLAMKFDGNSIGFLRLGQYTIDVE